MGKPEDEAVYEDSEESGDDISRCLLVCSALLLLAALFVKVHLIPAKQRFRVTAREQRTVETELDVLRSRNDSLEREVAALSADPVYRERLRRRMFRITTPEELVLKPHP